MKANKSLNAFLLGVTALIGLSGCSTIPDNMGGNTSMEAVRESATSNWSDTPAIVYRKSKQAAELLEPNRLPKKFYEKKLNMKLYGKVTVDQLVQVIQHSGVPIMMMDDSLAQKEIVLPRYNQTVGTLVDVLSFTSSLSFYWYKGALIVDKTTPYILKVPQDETLAKQIEKSLQGLGAKEVTLSNEAGMVAYKADTQTQTIIKTYLSKVAINTSMINLQVAVINVSLDREKRQGLDWSTLSLKAGDLGILETASSAATVVTDAAETAADAATTVATTTATKGVAGTLTSSGAGLVVKGGEASLDAVLNMLSTYGESTTTQNLSLKTLSGIEVKLNSSESIPYVEDVSLNVNETSSTSGVETSTVDTGFKVSIAPFFDAEEGIVTLKMDLSMKSLVGFRELQAGNDFGTISRPQIQEQAIENIARMEAGETVLVGGLVYESVTDNRNTLAGLEEYKVGSKALKLSKNALFILLRPSVVVYGPSQTLPEVN